MFKKKTEYAHIFKLCKKNIIKIIIRYMSHGSTKGGVATCIVICMKTVFVKTYTYLNNGRVVF